MNGLVSARFSIVIFSKSIFQEITPVYNVLNNIGINKMNKLEIFKDGSHTQCTSTAFQKGPLNAHKQYNTEVQFLDVGGKPEYPEKNLQKQN